MMHLLVVTYSGDSPEHIEQLFQKAGAGFSRVDRIHGGGRSGVREGTRAFPGEGSMLFSVLPSARAGELFQALKGLAQELPPGVRLHAGLLPVADFF